MPWVFHNTPTHMILPHLANGYMGFALTQALIPKEAPFQAFMQLNRALNNPRLRYIEPLLGFSTTR